MKDKKVNILLSTYNGEKYLEEQMRSLLNQDYPNFEIHVRDDGSQDGTKHIVQSYVDNYPNKVFLHEGENIGYKKSFQWLMQNCNNADYFSFCDQDDIWYPNKISRAISCLEKFDNEKPQVYLCDFYWCDEKMNREKLNKAYLKKHHIEKYVTLGDRNAFGFTEVFNKCVLEAVKDNVCFEKCSHDEIVYMYCLCNGGTYWDDFVGADYRRHGSNVSKQSLVGGNRFSHLLWRIKTFVFEANKTNTYKYMIAFYECFQNQLDGSARQIYELYLGNKGRVKKALMLKRYRDTIFDEISIRILFLIGKI